MANQLITIQRVQSDSLVSNALTDFYSVSYCMKNGFASHSLMENLLPIGGLLPLNTQKAGIMISRGKGRHIERIANYFVLIVVREGVLYIEEEGKEFEVRAGHSLLLWPGRRHCGTRNFGHDLQYFWLHFTLSSEAQEQTTLLVPQHTQLTRPDFVTELFRRFLDDQDREHLQPLGAALYAWMILMEVSDTRSPPDSRGAAALAGRASTFISTHFHEKISASDVASAVGYNAQYLGRVFQLTYRQSLAEAIRRTRINHAKSLLLHTDSNVSEIARQSGFEDIKYFQRVFKQLEGITPLRFRRLHARMTVNN
ncbi:HTH-type transcriptional activator Btr [Abditibacteriota bacterium]|nr:HTH-type transcriptional activator Btr [Abditibacteriota bacterium]